MPALPLPRYLADDLVALRPFVPEDATAAHEACRDPEIRRFTSFPEAQDASQTRAWIEAQPGMRERGEALDLAIVSIGEPTPVGAVGLTALAFEHRRAEIGYWIAPGARRRGIATAAVRLLSSWALGPPLSLVRLSVHADVDNAPSRRTAERAGYEFEGILRSYLCAKGRHWDVAMYSLIAGAERRSLCGAARPHRCTPKRPAATP